MAMRENWGWGFEARKRRIYDSLLAEALHILHTPTCFALCPPQIVRLPSHTLVRRQLHNEALRARMAGVARGPSSFFRTEISGGVKVGVLCARGHPRTGASARAGASVHARARTRVWRPLVA